MRARLAFLTLLTPLLALDQGTGAPAYAPGAYKYSLLTVIKSSQSVANNEVSSTLNAQQRLTLALSAHGDDSLAFQLTLTDYSLHSDLPVKLPDVSKMKGTMVMGTMSTRGRLGSYSHLSATTEGADVLSLAASMSKFLPVLVPVTGTAQEFTDTTAEQQSSGGGVLAKRTITTTTLDGDTVFAGVSAIRVRRATSELLEGPTMQGGQALMLSMQSAGLGTYYVSEKGVYLGARETNLSTSRYTLPDGSIITLTQDATSVVTLLK